MGGQDGSINLGRNGKFGNVNLSALKAGVKKADIKTREEIVLFNKLDADKNGILTQDELSKMQDSLKNFTEDGKITKNEAKKFLKEQGLKGQVDKKDVFGLLSTLDVASENIKATTQLTLEDGTEVINIEYNPQEDGTVITESLLDETGALYSKKSEKDGKAVTEFYNDAGKVSREVTEENNTVTTVNYDDNGNVTSKIRQKGSVSEYLGADDKVTKKVTDMGNGLSETVEYTYDSEGNVAKSVTKKPDGTQVIDDGKTIKTVAKDGSYTVQDKESQEVTSFDKDGKEVIENHKHKVEFGDTWYGIVQAKYGVTDHKTTMQIVRELKKHNNVSRSATSMPSEIELLGTIKLADGKEVKITDLDAVVDKRHNNLTNPNHIANRQPVDGGNATTAGPGSPATTMVLLENMYTASQASFDEQMKKDGWAADTADFVSNLWGWAQEDGNQAWRVRKDLAAYKSNIDTLKAAAAQGDEQFKTAFQNVYGVTYNQQAIDDYCAEPTPANFKRAFGNNKDIITRVNNYNESQDTGAKAVKTTVVVAGSVAAGIATGGASLAAQAGVMGVVGTAAVAGGTTFGLRMATEVTDLASNDIDGDISENISDITKQAAVEGTISALTAGTIKGVGGIGNSATSGTTTALATTADDAANAGAVVVKGAGNAADDFANAAGNMADDAASAGAKGATNAGASAADDAAGAGAKGAGNAGANTADEAANAGANAADDAVDATFVNNLSDKVGSSGINSLTSQESAQLAKILGITPDKLANLSKAEIKKLLIKFHPDRCKLEYAHQISTILTNMLRNAV